MTTNGSNGKSAQFHKTEQDGAKGQGYNADGKKFRPFGREKTIFLSTLDTNAMLYMMNHADHAIRVIRSKIGFQISAEKGMELLKEFEDTMVVVHKVTKKLAKAANVRYATPNTLKDRLKKEGGKDGQENRIENAETATVVAGDDTPATETKDDQKTDKKKSSKKK